MSPHIVVITGPTASGKTRLAVDLAEKYNLEILSADSRQVYRGLDIGTGKDLELFERGGHTVKHHLIDVAEPREVYNLYRYQQDCYRVIRELSGRHPLMLMVGGTGLYIEAVLKKYSLSDVKEHPGFREDAMQRDLEDLTSELKLKNPELFHKTDVASKKRVVRALEVNEFAGQDSPATTPPPEFTFEVFCLKLPLEESYQKIEIRLQDRLSQGMIDEVKNLLVSGLSMERMNLLGLEYKIIGNYLEQGQSVTEMKEILAREIRRTARGQMTWFRGFERRGIAVNWLENGDFPAITAHIETILR